MDIASEKIVTAAVGYLELGMPEDAANELESLLPKEKNTTELLRLRASIYHEAETWALLETVAKELTRREPQELGWWVNWAFATRRTTDIAAARKILLDAEKLHPESAIIHFNLGCYACQLGELDEAKRRVSNAINFDASYRAIAAADCDLEPIRDKISAGLP